QEAEQLAYADSVVAARQMPSQRTNSVGTPVSMDFRQKKDFYGHFVHASEGDTSASLCVENAHYRLWFDARGGRICKVELKGVRTFDTLPVVLFDERSAGVNRFGFEFVSDHLELNTNDFYFTLVRPHADSLCVAEGDSVEVEFRLYADKDEFSIDSNAYISYVYTVRDDDYRTGMEVRVHGMENHMVRVRSEWTLLWQLQLLRQEKNRKNELMATTVYYSDANDVEHLAESDVKYDSASNSTSLKWISFKQQYFTSTLIADSLFGHATLVSDPQLGDQAPARVLKTLRMRVAFPIHSFQDERYAFDFYFGPNKYKLLRQYKVKLENQIQLGGKLVAWINRYAVIPVFDFFSRFNWNYGLIILMLTIILKVVLLPLTYSNYRSTTKMRVMKPEIEAINAKYPKPEDAMKKQQATMAMYKQFGIKPAGGCLPMLLQWPILVAMFRFFPASYELRQQSFLWADDLSTYDSICNLPFTIPFYGDHVSLFTLLMTVATLAYTMLNNKQMASTGNEQSMKMMKWMMYLMPVMFLGIFNNYSAGLSYYYLLFNLTTFLQMFIFRYAVNDEKLRAKLLAKKKQPVKKSRWEARYEEMLRKQKAMQNAPANRR
ncbi:MAG: membrane protein insertase YidC, partial [Bacteroidales bacterium]|nr:membrane protein insertase YidC [Bacteroidales bacterium]